MRPHRSRSNRPRPSSVNEGAVPNSVRSAPAENARSPDPRNTTTRTSSSASMASSAAHSASRVAMSMAFSTSGRLRVTKATWLRTTYSRVNEFARRALHPVWLAQLALRLALHRLRKVLVDLRRQDLHLLARHAHLVRLPAPDASTIRVAEVRLFDHAADDMGHQVPGFVVVEFDLHYSEPSLVETYQPLRRIKRSVRSSRMLPSVSFIDTVRSAISPVPSTWSPRQRRTASLASSDRSTWSITWDTTRVIIDHASSGSRITCMRAPPPQMSECNDNGFDSTEHRECGPRYLPSKRGSRFSKNACRPSARSRVVCRITDRSSS